MHRASTFEANSQPNWGQPSGRDVKTTEIQKQPIQSDNLYTSAMRTHTMNLQRGNSMEENYKFSKNIFDQKKNSKIISSNYNDDSHPNQEDEDHHHYSVQKIGSQKKESIQEMNQQIAKVQQIVTDLNILGVGQSLASAKSKDSTARFQQEKESFRPQAKQEDNYYKKFAEFKELFKQTQESTKQKDTSQSSSNGPEAPQQHHQQSFRPTNQANSSDKIKLTESSYRQKSNEYGTENFHQRGTQPGFANSVKDTMMDRSNILNDLSVISSIHDQRDSVGVLLLELFKADESKARATVDSSTYQHERGTYNREQEIEFLIFKQNREIFSQIMVELKEQFVENFVNNSVAKVVQEIVTERQLVRMSNRVYLDPVIQDELINIIMDSIGIVQEEIREQQEIEQQILEAQGKAQIASQQKEQAQFQKISKSDLQEILEMTMENMEDSRVHFDNYDIENDDINFFQNSSDEEGAIQAEDTGEGAETNIVPRLSNFHKQKEKTQKNQDAYAEVLKKQKSREMKKNSPFVALTDNPQYLDVLCVNCYECVRFDDVDRHSQSCQQKDKFDKSAGYNGQNFQKQFVEETDLECLSSNQELYEDNYFDNGLADVNERIGKLLDAIKNRLIEIQLDSNQQDCPLSDLFSNLYAIGSRVYDSNDDPNNMAIMKKILDELLGDIQVQSRGMNNYRTISLYMFGKRLQLLNQEKMDLLVKFNSENYEVIEGNERDDLIRASTVMYKRRSQQILNDIRSEINSDKFENQSEYSDYSSASSNYQFSQLTMQQVRMKSQAQSVNHFNQQTPQQHRADSQRDRGSLSPSNSSDNNRYNYNTNFYQTEHSNRKTQDIYSTTNQNFQESASQFKSIRQDIKTQYNQNAKSQNQTPQHHQSRGRTTQDQYASSTLSPDSSHMIVQQSPNIVNQDIHSNLKKHFYSLVIQQLEQIGGKMPQGLSFAILYKESEIQNVNIDDWEQFIKEQLKGYKKSSYMI